MKLRMFAICMFCWGSFVEAKSVKITSFSYVVGRVAEICGAVTEADDKMSIVKILVDPDSKNPGTYTVVVPKEGSFCSTITSYRGVAEAYLIDENAQSKASNFFSKTKVYVDTENYRRTK
ncbi:MAG: hypothetical protein AB7O96_16610 [Pseudobdellovibrionaceae bacterium]